MNSFYSNEELECLGLKKYGNNVLISRKVSIYGVENISIGSNVRIDDFCILSGRIVLENYIHIAAYSALYGGSEGIHIEDFSNISSRVSIYSINDDYSGNSMTNPTIPDQYKKIESGRVYIQKHSIIGASSVVLPGVTIGEGSAFGSFSFINHDSAPWGIYAGIPFHFIKPRSCKLLSFEKQFSEKTK